MNTTRIVAVVALIALIALPCRANNDIPHEAKGFQESSYALSNYESINLANGNLTFTIPIHTLRTDGGLEYPVAAHFNSKFWFKHRYCNFSSFTFQNCGGEHGKIIDAEIADGVPSFGFGWELRPWRLIRPRGGVYLDDVDTSTWVLVTPSGARHKLGAKPWGGAGGGPGRSAEAAVGDRYYTGDGSNFRFTVLTVDPQGRATSIEMEDGSGTLFTFSQVVPLSCSGTWDLSPSDINLSQENFTVETAGLYLSKVERGPWDSNGIASNRIDVTYASSPSSWGENCASGSNTPWLPTTIQVHGSDDRKITFNYGDLHYYQSTFRVLTSISVPVFNPTHQSQAAVFGIIDWTLAGRLFNQLNNSQSHSFGAPHLMEVAFPEGEEFIFDQGSPSLPLENVQLPSGAFVEYDRAKTVTVGRAKCVEGPLGEDQRDSYVPAVCGMAPDDLQCTSNPAENPSDIVKDFGIRSRSITFADASTGGRSERTRFGYGLSCVGVPGGVDGWSDDQWPYDFTFALVHDHSVLGPKLYPEYTWTVVAKDDLSGEFSSSAEIHRFHGMTKEEFSIDYLEGTPEALTGALSIPAGDATSEFADNGWMAGAEVRRHVEIERSLSFGDDNPEDGSARYGYVKETRTWTDESDPNHPGNIKDPTSPCAPFVNPGVTVSYSPSCTEVKTTNSVDRYLQPRVSITRFLDPTATPPAFETQTTVTEYDLAYDETYDDDWFFARPARVTTLHSGETVVAARGWANLSATGQRPYFAPSNAIQNPTYATEALTSAGCPQDCSMVAFGYDGFGNVTSEAISGGYGPDFNALGTVTETEYTAGVPTKKELTFGGNSLLLWEREVDPNTGLARWHVDGAGIGFAYRWDTSGRLTDIAPLDSVYNFSWTHRLAANVNEEYTVGDDVPQFFPLYGTHVEYLLPSETASGMLEHRVYDATWSERDLSDQLTEGTWDPTTRRNRYVFDGLGRLTQEVESYPVFDAAGNHTTSQRSRFHLEFTHSPSSSVGCNVGHSWDIPFRSATRLDSEWIDGENWPGCPVEATWSQWTETQLDAIGRPAVIHQPDGSEVTFAYVGDTRSTTTRNVATGIGPQGNATQEALSTTTIKDALGRLRILEEDETSIQSFRTTYAYDARGNVTEVSLIHPTNASKSQSRTYSYTGAGWLASSGEPERNVTYVGYDGAGNVRTKTVDIVEYEIDYDDFGRWTSTAVANNLTTEQVWGDSSASTVVGNKEYNRVVSSVRHNYHQIAGLESTIDVQVKTGWQYSAPGGRVSRRSFSVSEIGHAEDEFATFSSYDLWGNRSRLEFPTFDNCRFSALQYIESGFDGSWPLAVRTADTFDDEDIVATVDYLPSGRVGEVRYRGDDTFGLRREVPDSSGMARPGRIEVEVGGLPVPPPGYVGHYAYDGAGNVTQMGAYRYAYDGLNRLTSFAEVPSPSRSLEDIEAFGYDRWGNLTDIDRGSSSKALGDYLSFVMADADGDGVPDDNRMESVSTNSAKGRATANLTWDNRGNLMAQAAAGPLRHKEFHWSDDDLLQKSIDDPNGSPTTWRYAYDAAGERVVKWRRGASGVDAIVYVRDENGSVISEWEYAAGGSGFDVIREYVSLGGMTVAEIDHRYVLDSMQYVVSDHLGSTRLLFDESQTTVEAMDYYPFGQVLTGNQTPETNHLFTGHERDLGTGSSELDYMHARYYSPVLARFLSVDPVMADTSSSQSWNRYSYVINNPVRLVDPNGETWLEATYGFFQGVGGSLSFGLVDITQPSPNDTADQRMGQMAGALTVQAVAAYHIANGTAKMGAGTGLLALSAVSSGSSAAPGGVLVAAGAGEVAAGVVLGAGATAYLSKATSEPSSAGRNDKHGKSEYKKSDQQQLDDLKKQLEKATTRREKIRIGNKIKRVKMNMDRERTGVNHSQTVKGNLQR